MAPKKRSRSQVNRSQVQASPTDMDALCQGPQRTMRWVLAAVCCAVGVISVLCWRWNYNSDGVLTGLMARSIIERGERPLFVWSVGYQGVLINAYANALVFKLFGVGPQQLSMWPTAAFWGLLLVFFGYVRRGLGERVALFTVAFLALSNPIMVAVLTRNVPNYPEIYLMGFALFVVERNLLERVRGGQSPYAWRSIAYFAAFGLECGFGAYTYGQIYLFMASVVAHLGLIYAKDTWEARRALPQHGRWLLMLAVGPTVVLLAGLYCFVSATAPPSPLAKVLGTSGLGMLMRAAVLYASVALVDLAKRHGRLLLALMPGAGAMVASAVVGYTPSLYEKYVRHQSVTNRALMDGDWKTFVDRMAYFAEGNAWHLNLLPVAGKAAEVNTPMLLLTLGILGFFLTFAVGHIKKFIAQKEGSHLVWTMGPLLMLPIVNILVFGLSSAVVNAYSSRYTLSLWFFYALAFGWFFATQLQAKSGAKAALMACLCLAMVGNNVRNLVTDVRAAFEQPFDGEEAIAPMREKGIRYGYANYWSAYTVNFLTNEEIILQPFYSAYCPHYGPIVAGADEVALVDHPDRLAAQSEGTRLKLGGHTFVTGDYVKRSRNAMLFLKKESTPEISGN